MACYDDEELETSSPRNVRKRKARDLSRSIPCYELKMARAYESCDSSAACSSDYSSTEDAHLSSFISSRRELMHKLYETTANAHFGSKDPQNKVLVRYFCGVADGRYRNPWLRDPWSKNCLQARLRLYIRMQLLKIAQEYGMNVGEMKESHLSAETALQRLNGELIDSLCRLGGFSRAILKCTQGNPVKLMLNKGQAIRTFPGQIDSFLCQSEMCTFDYENRTYKGDGFFLLEDASDGEYENVVEEDGKTQVKYQKKSVKLLCFCPLHAALYEVLHSIVHLNYNIQINCQTKVIELFSDLSDSDRRKVISKMDVNDFKMMIPYKFFEELISFCTQRYWALWAFGEPADWREKGSILKLSAILRDGTTIRRK